MIIDELSERNFFECSNPLSNISCCANTIDNAVMRTLNVEVLFHVNFKLDEETEITKW